MDQNGLSFLNYASVASHLAISKPKLKIKRKEITKNDVIHCTKLNQSFKIEWSVGPIS